MLGDLEVREPLLGCGQKRRELQPELHVVRGTLLIEPWKVAEGPQELIHLILFGRGASAAELLHRLGRLRADFSAVVGRRRADFGGSAGGLGSGSVQGSEKVAGLSAVDPLAGQIGRAHV